MLNLILLMIIPLSSAVMVDNSLEGDPEINCGPSDITVNFNTRNPFEGNIFVKGLFSDQECKYVPVFFPFTRLFCLLSFFIYFLVHTCLGALRETALSGSGCLCFEVGWGGGEGC